MDKSDTLSNSRLCLPRTGTAELWRVYIIGGKDPQGRAYFKIGTKKTERFSGLSSAKYRQYACYRNGGSNSDNIKWNFSIFEINIGARQQLDSLILGSTKFKEWRCIDRVSADGSKSIEILNDKVEFDKIFNPKNLALNSKRVGYGYNNYDELLRHLAILRIACWKQRFRIERFKINKT